MSEAAGEQHPEPVVETESGLPLEPFYEERNDVRLEDYACNDRHRDLSGVKGVEPR